MEEAVEKRTFVWEKIDRSGFVGGVDYKRGECPVMNLALGPKNDGKGWKPIENRNNMWKFGDNRGSVHWYPHGLVLLYLRGEFAHEGAFARVKELFCRAFFWMSPEEYSKYLDVPLQECSRKWIFKIGKIMPRFKIKRFERSHGLVVFTDGSHPDSLHVLETVPFWIDEQRDATAKLDTTVVGLSNTVTQLGIEIQEHLKLIHTWEKGASRNSEVATKTLEVLELIKKELSTKINTPSSATFSEKFTGATLYPRDSDTKFADYGD